MTPLNRRTQLKQQLAPLGVPVLFRGDQLPASGPHVLIDLISDVPLTTLDIEESGRYTTFQITVWAKEFSRSAELLEALHLLMEPLEYLRRITRYLTDGDWRGSQSDYEIFS